MDGELKPSTLQVSMICRAALRVFQLSPPCQTTLMHIIYWMGIDELGGHISEIPPKPSPSKPKCFV